jgi:hypothetical protein
VPVGVATLYGAIRHRFNVVGLSEMGVRVNNETLTWAELSRVAERAIFRRWRFLSRPILLKQLRNLELYGEQRPYPLIISTDWLTAVDYEIVYQRINQKCPVERTEEHHVT